MKEIIVMTMMKIDYKKLLKNNTKQCKPVMDLALKLQKKRVDGY